MSIDIKERIRLIIDHICNADIGEYEILASLRALLADLEAAEVQTEADLYYMKEPPPKPTGEQLKAIGKVLDGDAPRECKEGDMILAGNSWIICDGRIASQEHIGKLRWHLKDAPLRADDRHTAKYHFADAPKPSQPAQMICNHAGECKISCPRRGVHPYHLQCKEPNLAGEDCPFKGAVCVPWVEKVKHYSCGKCASKGRYACSETCFGDWDVSEMAYFRRNWTEARQPEPAAPDKTHEECFDCALQDLDLHGKCKGHKQGPVCCPNFVSRWVRLEHHNLGFPIPKEPDAEPGLVSCRWKQDDSGDWFTRCGEGWTFTDGGVAENRIKFCPYCGKPIEAVEYKEPMEEI